jgi:hypothetical protein
MKRPPFIIFALPRSRTVWLSKFLTYGEWVCKHDPLAEYLALPPIADYLMQPNRGIVDTGLVMYWRDMQKLMPFARAVCIHRKPQDVKGSLKKLGLAHLIDVDLLNEKLEELRAVDGVLHINYDDLNDLNTCYRLSTLCTGRFSVKWWRCLKDANIQLDLSKGIPSHIAALLNARK